MTFRSDLFAYVTGDAAVAALIGSRFYWTALRGDAYPASRFVVVNRDRNTGHSGPNTVETFDIQIDHYSADPDEVEAVALAFAAILNGVKAPASGISGAMQTNETDQFQDDGELFRLTQEYRIHHFV